MGMDEECGVALNFPYPYLHGCPSDKRNMSRPRLFILLLPVIVVTVAMMVGAQSRYYGGYVPHDVGVVPKERTGFTFCRLFYNRVRTEGGGQGWDTDYPGADRNLMIRLPEFTYTPITRDQDGSPQHAVVRGTDRALFECPFLFASDVGTIGMNESEAERLRDYLLKGGFLWVDDFWGARAWSHWTEQIARVLPEFSPVELPMDHPLFSTFYTVERVPQIPSIQFWRNNRNETSERGADSAEPRIHGIFDGEGRLMVLMSHNTDIADGWEREGEDWAFFHAFSPHGYAVGVNVAIWAMTH